MPKLVPTEMAEREREREMGPNGSGEINEIGELVADFCSINSLVI